MVSIYELHEAVERDDVESIKEHVKLYDVNEVNEEGLTALHIAVQKGNIDIARVLLENGANPDIISRAGYTALHQAIYAFNPDMVKLLLEYDSNIFIRGGRENQNAVQLSEMDEEINSIITAKKGSINSDPYYQFKTEKLDKFHEIKYCCEEIQRIGSQYFSCFSIMRNINPFSINNISDIDKNKDQIKTLKERVLQENDVEAQDKLSIVKAKVEEIDKLMAVYDEIEGLKEKIKEFLSQDDLGDKRKMYLERFDAQHQEIHTSSVRRAEQDTFQLREERRSTPMEQRMSRPSSLGTLGLDLGLRLQDPSRFRGAIGGLQQIIGELNSTSMEVIESLYRIRELNSASYLPPDMVGTENLRNLHTTYGRSSWAARIRDDHINRRRGDGDGQREL